MAYEFLQKLYGAPADGEAPRAMTYAELEAAIDADNSIRLANLAAGGYVTQSDFDAKITELDGIRQQLTDANAQIQSYKDMDIDGIKEAAANWETKYNTETQKLNDQLSQMAYQHAVEMAATGIQFSSNGARKAFISDLTAKKLPLENGKLLGYDDYLTAYKEADPGAFTPDTPQTTENKPYFSGSTTGDLGGDQSKTPVFNFGFSGVRKAK